MDPSSRHYDPKEKSARQYLVGLHSKDFYKIYICSGDEISAGDVNTIIILHGLLIIWSFSVDKGAGNLEFTEPMPCNVLLLSVFSFLLLILDCEVMPTFLHFIQKLSSSNDVFIQDCKFKCISWPKLHAFLINIKKFNA